MLEIKYKYENKILKSEIKSENILMTQKIVAVRDRSQKLRGTEGSVTNRTPSSGHLSRPKS